MWTCKNCGTENEGYVCTGCGAAYEEERTEDTPKKNKTYMVLIVALGVLLLALVVLLTVLLTMKKNEEPQPAQVVNVVTTVAPTESPEDTVYDDGTNEDFMEEPVWSTETAELTGVAAENDAPTYSRRNIHLTNVEEYIDKTIRPIYNMIAEKNKTLSSSETDGITKQFADASMPRMSDVTVVCVTYPAGTDGDPYSRQYYFDPATGEFIFAFIFDGTKEEHRLYFYKDSLIHHKVRHNGGEDVTTDNPTDDYLLSMANDAIREAYAGR